MRKVILAAAVAMLIPAMAVAQEALATAYTTDTTEIGTLLDDPAARAILDKHVPGMTTNDQVDMARAMTMRDIQQYSPDVLTDQVLAAIDADLAKLNPKN